MAAVTPLTLTTAIGSYPHILPLKDGRVTSVRLGLKHQEVVPANRAFRPMANQLAYDVSELALVTLLLAKDFARPLVGVPVVLMQQSAYNMLLVRADSPLHSPTDLADCTIGVRAYTQTTGTWLRGMLQDQFDLDLTRLEWVTFEDAHLDGFTDPPNTRRAPAGKTLAGMLRGGEIEAAAGLEPSEHPDLRTLIPDAREVEEDFVRRSGIRPINHTLVVRQDLATREPWIRDELFDMVRAAKKLVGGGPPDGIDAMRGPLTLLARYAFEQHITSRAWPPEELFSLT